MRGASPKFPLFGSILWAFALAVAVALPGKTMAQGAPEPANPSTLNQDRDIAAWARGGRVLKVPAGDPRAIIDAKPSLIAVPSGQSVALGAIGLETVLIEGVNIQLGAGAGGRSVEISASERGARGPFRKVAGRTALPVKAGWARIRFAARKAGVVQLRFQSADGKPIPVVEVQLIEARQTGYTPILARATAKPIEAAKRGAGGNIAAFRFGGRLLSASPHFARNAYALFDISTGTRRHIRIAKFPTAMTGHFFGKRRAKIDAINLYSPGAHPRTLELWVSETPEPKSFRKAGTAYLLPNKGGWKRITLPKVEARYFRLRVTSAWGKNADVREIEILQAKEPGAKLIYAPGDDAKTLRGLLNIANSALGGRLVSATSTANAKWPAANLIDGLTIDPGGFSNKSFGWASAPWKRNAPPNEIVLAFNGDKSARLRGIALDMRSLLNRRRGGGVGSFNSLPYRFEILVSNSAAGTGWRLVGKSRYARMSLSRQYFALPEVVEAKFVKLRLYDNYLGPAIQLGEVMVFEAKPEGDRRSVAAGRELDIAQVGLGGMLLTFTSEYDRNWPAVSLIDPLAGAKGWSSRDNRLPQRFTLAFNGFQEALIKGVVIDPRSGSNKAATGSPKKVKIAVSIDASPAKGWRTVGIFDLGSEMAPRRVMFERPMRARYLQLTVLENHGHNYTLIRRVHVIEAAASGYRPVFQRVPKAGAGPTGGPAVSVPPGDTTEHEPNNTKDQANALEMAKSLTGALKPIGDIDMFRFTVAEAGRVTNLTIEGFPFIKSHVTVSDGTGKAIARIDPSTASKKREFTWKLPAGDYLIELKEPKTSVVLVLDDSGSMRRRVADLRRAAAQYVQAKKPDEEMMVLKFATKVTVLQPFTTDKALLLKAVRGQLKADGSTALYAAIVQALKALDGRKGNRAILVLSDGADSGASRMPESAVFGALSKSGVRMYAVGLGTGLRVYNMRLGRSTGQMLDSWTRLTGGRYFFTPSSDRLLALYEVISRELRATPGYRIRVNQPEGAGALRLVEIGERIKGLSAPARVELILDASGSMRGRIKRQERKIVAAKRVLRTIVNTIPKGTVVALRVYGHRLPSKPKRKSCQDTELVVPFKPLDRAQMLAAIDRIKPRGQTPIGLSLRQVPKDFGDVPGFKLVLLVSDGIETCSASPRARDYPPKVVQQILDSGIKMRVNVVGFDVGRGRTSRFLRRIARVSGGRYFSARDAEELERSIRLAMAAAYTVHDSGGQLIARGAIGGPPARVPEGIYKVVVDTTPRIEVKDVRIATDKTTEVRINKEGQDVGIEVRPPR